MNKSLIMPVVIAAAVSSMVALMGETITDIGPWYRGLIQPPWAPPDFVYAIGWTVIFALIAIAGVNAWMATHDYREREWLLGWFALNGFLNLLWSFLFFRFHRPDWAVIEVVALWLSIAALIFVTSRRSKSAALLLLPYLLWVSFAGFLNLAVVRLNGSFS